MRLKRKRQDFCIVLFVLLTIVSNTFAKWGSSKSSSPSKSSPSYSRPSPSPSYSRPSPSYSSPSYSRPAPAPSYSSPSHSTYTRPSPASLSYSPSPASTFNTQSYPSPARQFHAPAYPSPAPTFNTQSYPSPAPQFHAPAYGFKPNAGSPSSGFTSHTPSFGTTAEKPITSNIGFNTNSANTGSKPNIGWNITPKPLVPAAPPISYPSTFPAVQSRPVSNTNAAPVYPQNVHTQPVYSQGMQTQPVYPQNVHTQPTYVQGMQTQPVYGQGYQPQPTYTPIRQAPAYSPSYNVAPGYNPSYNPGYHGSGYNPSHNHGYQNNQHYNTYPANNYGYSVPRQNTYNPYAQNQGYNQHNNYYGNTFGSHGLPQNSYLSNGYYGNNYYGKKKKSGFLTKALFFGGGMGGGYALGRYSSRHNRKHDNYRDDRYDRREREWSEDEDLKWRATTQGPYFENKVPGGDKILPASAVIGAATAFGLVSLLPLNVPLGKPLMYCNDTELWQSPIQINGNIYICYNNTVEIWCPPKIENVTVPTENQNGTVVTEQPQCVNITTDVSCPKTYENGTEVTDQSQCVNQTIQASCTNDIKETQCVSRIMQCDTVNERNNEIAYCISGVLYSTIPLACNESLPLNGFFENETISLLNCYDGLLPESRSGFIPTTSTTPAPTTTTERPLSFGAKAHIFFLRIIGKGDIIEKPKTTTLAPEIPQLSADAWYPEALTYPPDLNETMMEPPFEWMQPVQVKLENGTFVTQLEPVPLDVIEQQEKVNQMTNNGTSVTGNPLWVKVYMTYPTETTTPYMPNQLNETTTVTESSVKSEPSNT